MGFSRSDVNENRRKRDGTLANQITDILGAPVKMDAESFAASVVNRIELWFNREVLYFNPNSISHFRWEHQMTLEYSQMMWATTYQIGCGFVGYKEYENGHPTLRIYCNYAPAGNILGANVYIKGKACSKCPKGTKCEDGLCA